MKKEKIVKGKSKEVVEQEIAEFITVQKNYRGKFIEASFKKIEMEEYMVQIKIGQITALWAGIPMPEKLAKAYVNLLLFNFKELARELDGLKQKLILKGMDEKQLVELIENDVYVSKLK